LSVIDTVTWLKESSDQIEICKKLRPYFTNINERNIRKYLQSFGMYKSNQRTDKWIERAKKDKLLAFIKEEERKLKAEWNGPNSSIFILPSDENNRKIEIEYKGRSGLAFRNKLFLFLSLDTEKKDIRSLFIHEFHHVCRLAAVKKQEKHFTIIDTVIMEGLAENAVREKLSENEIASWAKLYSDDQCERFLKKIIYPQKDVTRENPKFSQMMFGTGFYPKMVGYAVGYYIVKDYMNKTGLKTKDLLSLPAEEFFKDLQ
jgi:uncharacterized protein YjaZ